MRIQILILGFEGLSNKDGDVNEKGKKPIGLDCQDNWLTLHVQHAFLHIYLPSLHGYNVKVLNFTFCGGREHLLGTLRSDDGDGNGNATKAIGLISKTTILHVHHAFLYISLPSLHDYDVKMPNFTLYRGSTQATTKFPLSFCTWIWFLGIQL